MRKRYIIVLLAFAFVLTFALNNTVSIAFANEYSDTIKDSLNENAEKAKQIEAKSMSESKKEIVETANKATFEGIIAGLQELSIPLLVGVVIGAAILFVIGIFIPPAKIVAYSMLGLGMLSFVLINYYDVVVGLIIAILRFVKDTLIPFIYLE